NQVVTSQQTIEHSPREDAINRRAFSQQKKKLRKRDSNIINQKFIAQQE
ncbi:35074_t:CDS:1, partial [Racocetra persica]